jgi:hypothetical protein
MFASTTKRFILATAALAAALPAVAADGVPGEQWEITTKMEMSGMPMALPAQTNKVCLPKDRKSDDELVPKDKNNDCKMEDIKRSGNKTTYTMRCTGKETFTGTGEMENNGDSYRGSMHIVGTMQGEAVDMKQTYSGKRLGTCTYEDLGKKYQAMAEKATADMCRKGVDDLTWVMFSDDPNYRSSNEACKPFKKAYCDKASKVAADLRTPAGFRAFTDKRKDWRDVIGVCGIAADGVLTDLCKKANDAQDWEVVVAQCPAEAKAAAAEHCAGRSYTAMMSGPYAPLCRNYGRDNMQGSPAAAPSKEDIIKGGVNEGVNKLKKLLPF